MWPDLVHPGVPLKFVYDQLKASPKWMEIHERAAQQTDTLDPFFEEGKIPEKPENPYAVATSTTMDIRYWAGATNQIESVVERVDIVSIRKYPQGEGTLFDFTESWNALFKSLALRFIFSEVFDHLGQKIGEVSDCSHIGNLKFRHFDGNFDVYHHGISVKIIYR